MRPALILVLLALPCPAQAQSRSHVVDEVNRFMLAFFDRIQPRSIAENVEYCGLVAFDPDGELRTTPPRAGSVDGCEPADAPEGWDVVASYHTHGAFLDDADSEVPSVDDLLGDIEEEIDGYVATPGGRVWLNLYEEKLTYQLCGRGCVVSDPKARPCKTFTPRIEYTLNQLRAREREKVEGC